MDRLRRIGAALALVTVAAFVAAGCGGTKTDVSGGVDNLNQRLTQQGIPAKLDCPKQVDGGAGTEFDCTLAATQGGKSTKVKMQVQKEGKNLVVDVKDQATFEKAIQTVAGQTGTQQQQAGPTGSSGTTP
jgi:protein-tyrosine-phosphatase